MNCKIHSKKVLREDFEKGLAEIGKAFKVNLSPGTIIKDWQLNGDKVNGKDLQATLEEFAAEKYFTIHTVNNLNEWVIKIDMDEVLEDHLSRVVRDEQTKLDKANLDTTKYRNLMGEFLRNKYEPKKQKMYEFINTALKNTGVSFKQKGLVEKVKKYFPESGERMIDQLEGMSRRLGDVIEQDEFEIFTRSFAVHILEIEVYTKELLEVINQLENTPESYIKAYQLGELAKAYESLIKDLHDEISQYDNVLAETVKNAHSNIGGILKKVNDIAKLHSLNEYDRILAPTTRKRQKDLRANLARLEKGLERPNLSEGVRKQLESKIKKLKDEIQNTVFNQVESIFEGNAGDISWWSSAIRSILANPDPVISGFGLKLKQIENLITDKMVKFTNELDNKYKEWQAQTDNKIGKFTDLQQYFDRFLEKVEVAYWDKKEQKMKSKFYYQLLSETSGEHDTRYSEFNAKLSMLRDFQDQGLETYIDPNENEISVVKAIKETLKQRTLFQRNTYEMPYSKEYYKSFDLMYEEIEDGKTLSEFLQPLSRELNDIRRDIQKFQKGIPTEDQLERLQQLTEEKKRLRSTVGKPEGSLLWKVAKQYQKYQEKANETAEYKMTPQAREQFNNAFSEQRRRRKAGEISRDELERWKEINTVESFSDSFNKQRENLWERKFELIDEINQILLENGEDIPEVNSGELFAELRNIVRPYRDRNSIINGRRIKGQELEEIYRIENELERLNDGVVNGIEKEDRITLANLSAERRAIGEQIDKLRELGKPVPRELFDRQKEITAEKAAVWNKYPDEISERHNELREINATLFEMQKHNPTRYFKEEAKVQFDKWYFQEKNRLIQGVREFTTVDKHVYTLEDVWKKDGQVFEGDILNQFKRAKSVRNLFKQSSWWVQNHKIVGQGANEKLSPIYIWSVSRPSDENQIIKNSPAFHWMERQVDKKFKNEKFEKERTVKKGLFPSDKYKKLTNKADREFLRWLTVEYLESQKVYHPGAQMGLKIPSLERVTDLVFDKSSRSRSFLTKKLKRGFITTAQDLDEEASIRQELGDSAGRIQKFQPIYYSNDIDSELVEKNIIFSITKYIQAAKKYEAIEEKVIPFYEATRSSLSTPNVENVTQAVPKWIKNAAEKLGLRNSLTTRKGLNNRKQVLDEFTDMFIFGERTKPVEKEVNIPFIGRKKLRLDKIFKSALGAQSFRVMAGQTAGQAANLWGANINAMVKFSINKGFVGFSHQDWLSAKKDFYMRYMGDLARDMGKLGNKSFIGQFSNLLGGVEGRFQDYMGKELDTNFARTALNTGNLLFIFKNSVELNISLTTFIAHAKSFQVEVDGKIMSLFEAFEREYKKDNVFKIPNITNWENVRDEFTAAQTKLIRDISGAYGTLDATLISTTILGQALEWMRRYLVAFYDSMYGHRRLDTSEGRYIQGYWNAGASFMVHFATMMKDVGISEYNFIWETASNEQQRGIQMMAIHTGALLLLWGIIVGVFGFDEDDEDRHKKLNKHSAVHNWLLYAFIKTQSEGSTLVFPHGIDEIAKIRDAGFAQLFPFLDESWKLFYKDLNYTAALTEEDFFEKYNRSGAGFEKGDVKFYHDVLKIIGIGGNRTDAVERIRNHIGLRNR